MLLSEQWSIFFFNTKCTRGILSILLSYLCWDTYVSLEQLLFLCSLIKQIWIVTAIWLPRFNSYHFCPKGPECALWYCVPLLSYFEQFWLRISGHIKIECKLWKVIYHSVWWVAEQLQDVMQITNKTIKIGKK